MGKVTNKSFAIVVAIVIMFTSECQTYRLRRQAVFDSEEKVSKTNVDRVANKMSANSMKQSTNSTSEKAQQTATIIDNIISSILKKMTSKSNPHKNGTNAIGAISKQRINLSKSRSTVTKPGLKSMGTSSNVIQSTSKQLQMPSDVSNPVVQPRISNADHTSTASDNTPVKDTVAWVGVNSAVDNPVNIPLNQQERHVPQQERPHGVSIKQMGDPAVENPVTVPLNQQERQVPQQEKQHGVSIIKYGVISAVENPVNIPLNQQQERQVPQQERQPGLSNIMKTSNMDYSPQNVQSKIPMIDSHVTKFSVQILKGQVPQDKQTADGSARNIRKPETSLLVITSTTPPIKRITDTNIQLSPLDALDRSYPVYDIDGSALIGDPSKDPLSNGNAISQPLTYEKNIPQASTILENSPNDYNEGPPSARADANTKKEPSAQTVTTDKPTLISNNGDTPAGPIMLNASIKINENTNPSVNKIDRPVTEMSKNTPQKQHSQMDTLMDMHSTKDQTLTTSYQLSTSTPNTEPINTNVNVQPESTSEAINSFSGTHTTRQSNELLTEIHTTTAPENSMDLSTTHVDNQNAIDTIPVDIPMNTLPDVKTTQGLLPPTTYPVNNVINTVPPRQSSVVNNSVLPPAGNIPPYSSPNSNVPNPSMNPFPNYSSLNRQEINAPPQSLTRNDRPPSPYHKPTPISTLRDLQLLLNKIMTPTNRYNDKPPTNRYNDIPPTNRYNNIPPTRNIPRTPPINAYRNTPTNNRNIPTNQRNIPTNHRNIPTNHRNIPTYHRNIPANNRHQLTHRGNPPPNNYINNGPVSRAVPPSPNTYQERPYVRNSPKTSYQGQSNTKYISRKSAVVNRRTNPSINTYTNYGNPSNAPPKVSIVIRGNKIEAFDVSGNINVHGV